MAVIHSPETRYAQERSKWETQYTWDGIPPGKPPYVFQEFPKMLYRANRRAGLTPEANEQRIVDNADQEALAYGQGWRQSQQEAIDALIAADQSKAVAAAHRNYEDRNMGEKARAEANAFESQTSDHVAEIPHTPIKRRGRPRKKAEVPA